MSEYSTEFWFDAVENTVIGWKGYFATEEEARKVFDAWLDSIRAEAWREGYGLGLRDMDRLRAGELRFQNIATNPYLGGEAA